MERWDWKQKRHVAKFRGERFAALDPGQHGCLMVCDWELGVLPVRLANPLHVEVCAKMLAALDVHVLVAETQYVTNPRLARAVTELTFSMGILVGFAAARLEWPLQLFEVAPASWQAEQKRRHAPEEPKRKGFAADLMMTVGKAQLGQTLDWRQADQSAQTGLAAAWAIAEWWRAL